MENTKIECGMGGLNVMEIENECEHGYTQIHFLNYARDGEQPSWEEVKKNGGCLGSCPFGCHDTEGK